MDMHQLTPDDLAAAGRALYGAHWQGQLAQALSVGDRTLRRWLSRELPIPEGLEYQLYELLEKRMRLVGGLVAFDVRLDVRGVLHHPSGAYFRIDEGDNVTLLPDPRHFRGYDLASIEAGAVAAVQRERARERRTVVTGGFGCIRA